MAKGKGGERNLNGTIELPPGVHFEADIYRDGVLIGTMTMKVAR